MPRARHSTLQILKVNLERNPVEALVTVILQKTEGLITMAPFGLA